MRALTEEQMKSVYSLLIQMNPNATARDFAEVLISKLDIMGDNNPMIPLNNDRTDKPNNN